MNIKKILEHPRSVQAMIGISQREFKELEVTFKQCLIENKRRASKAQSRQFGGGRIGALATIQEKLFFILFYLKAYPTFDLLGACFNFDATNACKNTHILLAALDI